jgi:hypothetical protein
MKEKSESVSEAGGPVSLSVGGGDCGAAALVVAGSKPAGDNETLYLCNFRVSVDGDWLCLKEELAEVQKAEAAEAAAAAEAKKEAIRRKIRPPDTLAITPELERLAALYPNYPVGNAKGAFLNYFVSYKLTFQKAKNSSEDIFKGYPQHMLLYATLPYCTLLYAMLLYASLLYATLRYATLRFTTLRYFTLLYATLRYATIRYFTLLHATLRYSTLLYDTLRYFTLRYATLRYATLRYATLRYATLRYATIMYCDLTL